MEYIACGAVKDVCDFAVAFTQKGKMKFGKNLFQKIGIQERQQKMAVPMGSFNMNCSTHSRMAGSSRVQSDYQHGESALLFLCIKTLKLILGQSYLKTEKQKICRRQRTRQSHNLYQYF